MKIAVDFDGTVAEHAGFPAIGEPMEAVAWALSKLYVRGHTLILWTCRYGAGLPDVTEWLGNHGLLRYFNRINENGHIPDKYGTGLIDPRKIIAKVYVDDRNVGGFKGWPEIVRQISEAYCRKCDDVHWPQDVPCLAQRGG